MTGITGREFLPGKGGAYCANFSKIASISSKVGGNPITTSGKRLEVMAMARRWEHLSAYLHISVSA